MAPDFVLPYKDIGVLGPKITKDFILYKEKIISIIIIMLKSIQLYHVSLADPELGKKLLNFLELHNELLKNLNPHLKLYLIWRKN